MANIKKNYFWPELVECRCIKREDKIYLFNKNYNALFSIGLEDGTVEIYSSLQNESFDVQFLVIALWEYKSSFLCVPYAAEQIHVIDLDTKNEKGQAAIGSGLLHRGYFYNVHMEGRFSYLFPFTGENIVKIDMEKRELIRSINLSEAYRRFEGNEYTYFSNSGCYVYGGKAYMVMYSEAVIAEFDAAAMRTKFYRFAGESSYYVHISGCGNKAYILGSDDDIYIWNIEKMEFIKKVGISHTEENDRFKFSVRKGKDLYIFKYIFSKDFIRIDTDTDEAGIFSFNDWLNLRDSENLALNYMAEDKGIFYFLSCDRKVYGMDFDTGSIRITSLKMDEKEVEGFIRSHDDELYKPVETPIQEGVGVWTLQNYITKHVASLSPNRIGENGDRIGTAIYCETR